METLVMATLDAGSIQGTGDRRGRPLAEVTDVVSGRGQRLSQRVSIAVTIETLTEEGLLHRQTINDEEWLVPTDEGRDRAAAARQDLSSIDVELVEGGTRSAVPLAEVAATLDRSPVAVAAECSDKGVYHRRDREPAEGLVGRDEQRQQLRAVLDRVRQSRQGAVSIVHGPSGIGKTTLVEEVIADPPAGVGVVRTRCSEGGDQPYQPLRDALAQLDPDADPFAASGLAVEDPDSYEAQQSALFHDVTELLSPDSGVRVLFLDDVDMADASTWSYLEYLRGHLPDHPILVLATHRPGTLPADAPIRPRDGDGPPVTTIELAGLDVTETERLIEQVLDRSGVPGEFATAVHDRTAGNPLFVETTVETLLERDQLDPQFRWYPDDASGIDLPEAVHETVTEQIGLLGESAREVLEWVAIAAESVSMAVLQSVADASGERVAAIADTLVDAGLLDRVGEGDRVVARNTIVREALVEGIEPAVVARRNRILAETLAETVDDADPRQDRHEGAATIATHYEEAGDVEAAIEWYQEAAERATDIYAHETAIDQYHRVLEVARSADITETVLSTGQRLAEIYQTTSEYEQASQYVQFVRERIQESGTTRGRRNARLAAEIAVNRAEYETAIAEATDAVDACDDPDREQCRLLAVKADAEMYRGDLEQAGETVQRLQVVAEQLDAPDIEATAAEKLGMIARRQGEQTRSHECYSEALEKYRTADDCHGEADALNSLAIIADTRSNLQTAREYYERALETYREVGDRHQAAKVLQNLAGVELKEANYDRAVEAHETALETGESVGDPLLVAAIRLNLSTIMTLRAEYDRSKHHVRTALEMVDSDTNPRATAAARRALGDTLVELGEYERAHDCLREALDLLEPLGDRYQEGIALKLLGTVARKRGRYDRASEHYEAALDAAESVGNRELTADVRAKTGLLCYRRGDYNEAREHSRAARDLFRDDSPDTSVALCTLGLVALERSEFDRAREHFQNAIDVTVSPHRVAEARTGIGQLELLTGNPGRAAEVLDGTIETLEELGAVHDAARARHVRGRVAAESDKPTEARTRWERALDTLAGIRVVPDALDTLEALVTLDRDLGNRADAVAWCDRAVSLIETSDVPTDRDAWFREQRRDLAD